MSEFEQKKIWDPVTRVWHWVLVLSVSVGWSFGKFMSLQKPLPTFVNPGLQIIYLLRSDMLKTSL